MKARPPAHIPTKLQPGTRELVSGSSVELDHHHAGQPAFVVPTAPMAVKSVYNLVCIKGKGASEPSFTRRCELKTTPLHLQDQPESSE